MEDGGWWMVDGGWITENGKPKTRDQKPKTKDPKKESRSAGLAGPGDRDLVVAVMPHRGLVVPVAGQASWGQAEAVPVGVRRRTRVNLGIRTVNRSWRGSGGSAV